MERWLFSFSNIIGYYFFLVFFRGREDFFLIGSSIFYSDNLAVICFIRFGLIFGIYFMWKIFIL